MAKKQNSQTDSKQGRVLVTGIYGNVDDVIEFASDAVEAAQESGQVDFHPDAVAYALTLKNEANA